MDVEGIRIEADAGRSAAELADIDDAYARSQLPRVEAYERELVGRIRFLMRGGELANAEAQLKELKDTRRSMSVLKSMLKMEVVHASAE